MARFTGFGGYVPRGAVRRRVPGYGVPGWGKGMGSARTHWNGRLLIAKMDNACGRAVIGIGERIVVDGKVNAHVISGGLRRSIHLAEISADHEGDEFAAMTGDIPNSRNVTHEGAASVMNVGSWMPYACVEEVGRGHQFITPAVESARAYAGAVVRLALASEGLFSTKLYSSA